MARHPFQRTGQPRGEDIVRNLNEFFEKEWGENLPDYIETKKKWVQSSGPEVLPQLKRFYAEALLFTSITKSSDSFEIPLELKDYRLFGDECPALEELMHLQGAVSVFPTTCSGTSSSAEKWRLYVFKLKDKRQWNDHRRFLQDSYIVDNETIVFLSNGYGCVMPINGNSWQLAYRMAQYTFEQPNLKILRSLAYEYLITGAIKENDVLSVEIGKKADLVREGHRQLIYPDDCQNEIPDAIRKKCRGVKQVDQSWRFISGTGIEKPTTVFLPDKLQNLHILVGGTMRPVLSVILQLNPCKTILWCSETTRQKGKLIQEILQLIPEFHSDVEIKVLDSHDLKSCYQKLRSNVHGSGDTDLISITGGNRLMGIAAQLVAQETNIKLVYRDIDASAKTLTLIQFGQKNNYESNDIPCNKCPFDTLINWDWLYQKGIEPDQAEQYIKFIYKK